MAANREEKKPRGTASDRQASQPNSNSHDDGL